MDVIPERPTMTTMTGEVEVAWPRRQWSMSDNSTTAVDVSRLARLRTLHKQTMSNWTGSLDDPVFDYLNIPLVKVRRRSPYRLFYMVLRMVLSDGIS